MGLLDTIKKNKVPLGIFIVLCVLAVVIIVAVTRTEDFRTMVSARENKKIDYVMSVLSSRWRSTDGGTFMFESETVPLDAHLKVLYGNANKKITRLELYNRVWRYISINKLQNGNVVTLDVTLRKLFNIRDSNVTTIPVSQVEALGAPVSFVVRKSNNRVTKSKYRFVSAYIDVSNKILYADFVDDMGDGLNVRVVGNRISISSLGCRVASKKCMSMEGDRM